MFQLVYLSLYNWYRFNLLLLLKLERGVLVCMKPPQLGCRYASVEVRLGCIESWMVQLLWEFYFINCYLCSSNNKVFLLGMFCMPYVDYVLRAFFYTCIDSINLVVLILVIFKLCSVVIWFYLVSCQVIFRHELNRIPLPKLEPVSYLVELVLQTRMTPTAGNTILSCLRIRIRVNMAPKSY